LPVFLPQNRVESHPSLEYQAGKGNQYRAEKRQQAKPSGGFSHLADVLFGYSERRLNHKLVNGVESANCFSSCRAGTYGRMPEPLKEGFGGSV
jgi:hypothetical protein